MKAPTDKQLEAWHRAICPVPHRLNTIIDRLQQSETENGLELDALHTALSNAVVALFDAHGAIERELAERAGEGN